MTNELREKIKQILLNSEYKSQINCILKTLAQVNITDWASLQNLPRIGHFCQVDVYQLLAVINAGWATEYPAKTRKPKVATPVVVANEPVMEENNGESNQTK